MNEVGLSALIGNLLECCWLRPKSVKSVFNDLHVKLRRGQIM